jgi:hypothetical protein
MLGDDHPAKLEYSYRRWRELEKKRKTTLLVKTGLLNFGPVDVDGRWFCVDAALALATHAHTLPHTHTHTHTHTHAHTHTHNVSPCNGSMNCP